jgi:hypothetical protein
MKVEINQTINKIEITSKGKVEIKDNVMPIEIYKCKVVEGGSILPIDKIWVAKIDTLSTAQNNPNVSVFLNTFENPFIVTRVATGAYVISNPEINIIDTEIDMLSCQSTGAGSNSLLFRRFNDNSIIITVHNYANLIQQLDNRFNQIVKIYKYKI